MHFRKMAENKKYPTMYTYYKNLGKKSLYPDEYSLNTDLDTAHQNQEF